MRIATQAGSPKARALGTLVLAVWCGSCRLAFDPLLDGDGSVGGSADGMDSDPSMACSPAFTPFEITIAGQRNWLGGLGWNGTTGAVAYVEDPANASTLLYETFGLDGSTGPKSTLGVVGPSEAPTLAVDSTGAFRLAAVVGTQRDVVYSIDGASATIVSSAGSAFSVRVAPLPGGGAAYLWGQLAGGNGNLERRLSVLDGSGATVVNSMVIGARSMSVHGHALVWTGTQLLVLYADGTANRLMLQAVSTSGVTLGNPVELAAVTPIGIAAAWTGDRLLVAWQTSVVDVVYVAADGTLLTPVTEVGGSSFTFFFDVATGPASDLVFWNNLYDIHVVRVARDGTIGATTMLNGESVDAIWGGTSWLVGVSAMPGPGEITINSLCP